MKNYKILVIAILLCFDISYSQSGWVWQNPKPFGSAGYYQCHFPNVNTGWVLGGNFVGKTTDGGVSWTKYFERSPFQLYNLFVLNPNTAYVSGSQNICYLTQNGGASWDTMRVPGSLFQTDRIYFKNELTGFFTQGKNIARTTNGGLNWTVSVTPGSEPVGSIKLFNDNDGIMFCYVADSPARLYKTTNGGVNWVNPITISGDLTEAAFFDLSTGWLCGNRLLVKTTNGGINWITQISDKSLSFNSLKFINDQILFVCGADGKIFKTINGGSNWILLNTGISNYMFDISPVDANTVYSTSTYSTLIKTTNGGSTWSNLFSSFTNILMYDVQALSHSLIFTTGALNVNEPYIGKSTNGGLNWEFLPTIIKYIEKIFFVNEQTGWVGGMMGLAKTTNGGISWNEHSEISASSAIQFLNAQTGWSINSIYINKTTNGGSNWSTVSFQNGLVDFRFINDATGFAIAYNGELHKSTNGGNNWSSISNGGFTAKSCAFINEANMIAVSNSNNVYRTTNAGLNWTNISMGFQVERLKFINSLTGWAVGDENVATTTNGGINWITQLKNKFGGADIYACDFIDANTGWITGEFGSILKTTTGGNVFISQISTEIPEKYSLHQNYPNPFNPTTNIKFDIHKQGIATLKVYDLLGKEMETLVDEQLSVGTYEVTFNAGSLPSGIYFYVLKTGDFVESKKMILVK